MRFSAVAVVAALSSLAAAQDVLGSLPKCAQDCFGDSLGNCAQLDFKCICGNKQLISNLSCCVSKTCSASDQESIIKTASGLCKAVGVDTPTSASCASGASSTSAPKSTSSAKSSGSSGSSGSAGSASTSASSGSSSGSATSAAASGTSAAAAGQSSTAGSSAAAPMATAGVGMAMGMAGLLVAL